MKLKYIYTLLLISSIGMISCKKSDSTEGDKIKEVTVDKAKMVKVMSGKNRAKLSFLLNANSDVSKAVVFWNSSADSIIIPVNSTNKQDTISTFISGLTEKSYDFLFYTYDGKGNRSDGTLIREKIYGDLYESKLVNKVITSSVLEADGNVVIDWGGGSEIIGVELAYTDESGLKHEILIPKNETQTILKRYKRNSAFEYRTLFKPSASNIDTFYALAKKDNSVLQGPALVGTILERIIANSGIVKTVVSSTTGNELYAGLEESYLQFIDKNNRPQSLFIMQVDLNNEKLSLEIGTPSDGIDHGLQTVSDMIKAKNQNSKDKRVIAGVNGDYFQLATGIPSGPTVKNGVELRTLTSTTYCFVAALKNNFCLIGEGASLYQSNLSSMNEALGAKHLLVSEGVLLTPTDGAQNPRTTVGIIGISKLIFVVVDGRQEGYSVGLSLSEIGAIHKAIGVKNAVNLDGGGSTTFIVKDMTDQYVIKNKVSDGSPRRVGNALLIMEKK